MIESKPDLGPISEKISILEKEIEDLKYNLDDLKKDENTKTSAVLENKINQKKNEIDKIKQQNSELKLEIGKLDSLKNEIKELIKERNANKGETEFAHKNSSRQMTGKRPPVKTSINQNTVSGQTNLGQKDKTFRKGVIDALSDAQKLAKTIEQHKNNKSNIQVTGYRLNGDKMNIEGYYTQPNSVRTRFDYHVKVNPADKEKIQSTFRNSNNQKITQVDYNDILIRGSKK